MNYRLAIALVRACSRCRNSAEGTHEGANVVSDVAKGFRVRGAISSWIAAEAQSALFAGGLWRGKSYSGAVYQVPWRSMEQEPGPAGCIIVDGLRRVDEK